MYSKLQPYHKQLIIVILSCYLIGSFQNSIYEGLHFLSHIGDPHYAPHTHHGELKTDDHEHLLNFDSQKNDSNQTTEKPAPKEKYEFTKIQTFPFQATQFKTVANFSFNIFYTKNHKSQHFPPPKYSPQT